MFPLAIVNPADAFVPPRFGNVFVDNGKSALSQYLARFTQHYARVLCVMQDVAQQHRIN